MRRFAACLLLVSCSSFNGDASPVDDGGVPSSEAGTDGGGPTCPGKIVYVSAQSTTDSGDGCSAATAKKTIPAAIDRAKALGDTGVEVHVCAGSYGEAITLDVPVSVRGGYDCTTFTRAPTFGLSPIDPATGIATLDPVNATFLQSFGATVTFNVKGALPEAVTIDGFFVFAPKVTLDANQDNPGTVAFAFSVGAATTLENCEIEGASVKASNTLGSAGILIGDANPNIRRVRVGGGAAESTDPAGTGSAAIVGGNGARIRVTASSIDQGAGIGLSTGSAGIVGLGMVDLDVEGSGFTRSGGKGGNTASGAIAAYGAASTPVSIRNNRFHAAAPATCQLADCSAFAISVLGTKALLSGNYIDVGEVTGPTSEAKKVTSYGIALTGSSEGTIDDNVIHAGDVTASVSSVGIAYHGPASPPFASNERIAHNTIFAEQGMVLGGYTGLTIEDNLFVAVGAPVSLPDPRAALVKQCEPQNTILVGTVSNNAFVGYPTLALDGCLGTKPMTLASLSPSFVAANNTRLANSCAGDTAATCKAFPGCDADCTAAVFTAFQAPGHTSLFEAGWKPPSTMSCLVAEGATSTEPKDVDGATRLGTGSAKGAYVFAGTCAN